MKARRQSALVEIVQRAPVRSQEPRSRDIRDLGLVKGGAGGAYQAPPQPQRTPPNGQSLLHRAAADYLARVDRVQQMVVLRTGPRQAPLLGVAIDAAHLPEVV